MNKAEFIAAMAKDTQHTKAVCEQFLDAFTKTITRNIQKKDGIRLIGFGTFNTTKRSARNGRNPQTGKTIKIPARIVPRFRAGATLKSAVRKTK